MTSCHLILVVDDDPIVRNGLARILQRSGAEVITASHGREALELLRRTGARPDLVFTDLEMPIVGGEELIRTLRADASLSSIPVVVVSGTRTEGPFDLYIPKPFGAAEILLAARMLCSGAPAAA